MRSNLPLVNKNSGMYAVSKLWRTHIASAARICVCQPRATDILTLLNQLKVPDAVVPRNLHGEAQAAHACADDQDFGVKRHGVAM